MGVFNGEFLCHLGRLSARQSKLPLPSRLGTTTVGVGGVTRFRSTHFWPCTVLVAADFSVGVVDTMAISLCHLRLSCRIHACLGSRTWSNAWQCPADHGLDCLAAARVGMAALLPICNRSVGLNES